MPYTTRNLRPGVNTLATRIVTGKRKFMLHKFARDPKVKRLLEDSQDAMDIIISEIKRTISEIYVKIEDPELTDSEIRSYLSQIKGLKLALGIIPTRT